MKVLVTGAAGFITGYLIEGLLSRGHEVVGIDNHSKYGRVEKGYDKDKRYIFVEGDCKDAGFLKGLIKDCDQAVAGAAKFGGATAVNNAWGGARERREARVSGR